MNLSAETARRRMARDLRTLHEDCWAGAMYFRQRVRLSEGLAKRPSIQRVGTHFFASTMLGLQELVFVRLGRVLDSHRDSVSIFKFLNFVEQNPAVFAEASPANVRHLVKRHRKTLSALQGDIDKVRHLRDRRFAHRDNSVTQEDLTAWSLPPDSIRTLFDAVAHIINDYEGMHENAEYAMEFLGEDDVDHVLWLLERAVERPRPNREQGP